MKRGDSLLRLKRFRVEEMKRQMATLDSMKLDAERKLADLEDSVVRERQRAGDSDIGRLAFPSFLRSIEVRRENLRATLKEIERERAIAQGELNVAFQDLKSLEFAAEQQARRVAEGEARRSQSRLDEIELVRHLRKHQALAARTPPAWADNVDAAIRVPRTRREEHRFRLACRADRAMAGVALELRLMAAPDFRRSAPPVPVDRRAARARNLRGVKVSSLQNSPNAS